MQFDHLCKEKKCLLVFYVILPRVVCCKPWFNTECKDVIKARKSTLPNFRTNITSQNLSNFRIVRTRARRACRDNNRASWQQYVSKLNSRTTLKSTWDIVRRISGQYKTTTVKSNNNQTST